MKLLKNAAVAGATLTLLFGLTACGGDDSRPSAGEISSALQSDDAVIPVPEAAADCVAKVFYDSELSDETLQAMVDQDKEYEGSDEDREVINDLTASMAEECGDELAQ